MAKLAIFDFDGTLIDSLPDIAFFVRQTLKHFGAPDRSVDEIRSFIGNGAKNLINRSFGGALSEQELAERLNYYGTAYKNSGSPLTTVFDGIFDVVSALKARGYKLAVLTNKPQDQTDKIFDKLFCGVGFDAVIGTREDRKRKPDPSELIKLMEEFGAEREQTYMIGDGETDVMTAQSAGVNAVNVLWGYRSKEQLASAGATVFLSNPKELLEIIK